MSRCREKGEKISAVDGTSLVCKSCQDKNLKKAFENSRELKKPENENVKTKTLLQGLTPLFNFNVHL